MRILALDTALAACSAAIWCAGRVAARRRDERGQAHAEALLPMIAGVLKEAGIGYRDLDALAVTIGPGSFTGLRIGLATARGLSLALGKPIIGVGTLEAVAEMAPFDGSVLAVLDARRGEVYAQIFGPMHQPLSAPQALTAAAAAAAVAAAPPGGVVIGSGAARVWPFIAAQRTDWRVLDGAAGSDAATVAALAAARALSLPDPTAVGARPLPLYLRATEARRTP